MVEVKTVFEKQKLLNCDHLTFSECDLCLLNLLRPYLIQSEENTLEGSEILQILTQFKQVLDGGGAIGLGIDGRVQFMTPRAEELLKQYFSSQESEALPESLLHWFKHQISQVSLGHEPSLCIPLHVEQAGRKLIVRLISAAEREQYLLLLEEQELPSFSISALELLGLTKREAEVLFWIAKDKSTAGIAKVLDCCEGTVRKHLEHVYKKLGVQSRMGAVMVALERLGVLKGEFVARSS